ncbi:MAG: PDC sensor domain-containing protein [Bacillota bacterium]
MVTKKPVISIAMPVNDDQGQFAGVLGIDVSLKNINRSIYKLKGKGAA